MNKLKHIALLLFLTASNLLRAHWPEDNYLSKDNNINKTSFRNTSSIFVKQNQNNIPVVSFSSCINKNYVTGIEVKKKGKTNFCLLDRDFKLKLKLNRNLALIFSYN